MRITNTWKEGRNRRCTLDDGRYAESINKLALFSGLTVEQIKANVRKHAGNWLHDDILTIPRRGRPITSEEEKRKKIIISIGQKYVNQRLAAARRKSKFMKNITAADLGKMDAWRYSRGLECSGSVL